ncbi:O-antigen polysaccharide polymerase Wzy [Vibrio breoganii]
MNYTDEVKLHNARFLYLVINIIMTALFLMLSISYEIFGFWGYEILSLMMFGYFCIILNISVSNSSLYSAFSLFLILSVVFIYGRFFLELVHLYDYNSFDLFYHGEILIETKFKVLQLLISCMLGASTAFLLFYSKYSLEIQNDRFLETFAITLIKVVSVPLLFNYIVELKYIISHGYLAIFTGQMRSSTNTILPYLLPRLLLFLYYVFLSSLPSKENFRKVSFFVLAILLVNALKGQRGEILLMAITMLWYYCHVYSEKVNIKKSLILLSVVLIFSEIMVNVRVDKEIDAMMLLDAPVSFIEVNGLSSNIPMYMIQFYEDLESVGVPYFFGATYDYFYRIFVDRDVFYAGPSPELIEASKFLPFHMINYINQASFYNGNGTGSSYLAELYDLSGIYASFFTMFLITAFVVSIEKYALKYRYILLVSPLIIGKFTYMPRDSFMKLFDDLIPNSVIFLFILLFIRITKGKKNA